MPDLYIFNSAHASCTVTGTTSGTYTYTAATINNDAVLTYTGTMRCYGGVQHQKFQVICV